MSGISLCGVLTAVDDGGARVEYLSHSVAHELLDHPVVVLVRNGAAYERKT